MNKPLSRQGFFCELLAQLQDRVAEFSPRSVVVACQKSIAVYRPTVSKPVVFLGLPGLGFRRDPGA